MIKHDKTDMIYEMPSRFVMNIHQRTAPSRWWASNIGDARVQCSVQLHLWIALDVVELAAFPTNLQISNDLDLDSQNWFPQHHFP